MSLPSSPALRVSGPPAPAIAAVFGPTRPARAGLGERPSSASSPVKRKARPAPARVAEAVAERTERTRVRPASRSAARRTVHRVKARTVAHKVVRKARKAPAARRGMSAVVAFAWSHVGTPYSRMDCSKFVSLAYKAAGFDLPAQSGAIARRTYSITWSQARPGDVIVGRGHVGVYMGKRGGRHMMIDSGNSRTGVTYREVYRNSQGLHPERL